MKSQELKGLQVRLHKTNADIKIARGEIHDKQQHVKMLESQAKGLLNKINNLAQKDVIVSEHAMIRFIERAMGLDISNQISERVLTDAFTKLVNEMGDGKYPIEDGLVAVVKSGTVVTFHGNLDEDAQ